MLQYFRGNSEPPSDDVIMAMAVGSEPYYDGSADDVAIAAHQAGGDTNPHHASTATESHIYITTKGGTVIVSQATVAAAGSDSMVH